MQQLSRIISLLLVFGNAYLVNSFLVSNGLQRVKTKFGEIVGHVNNVQFDGKSSQVASYLGIPYAQPPVGDLRFRKPVPIKTMPSPYSAHSYRPKCLQQEAFGQSGGTYSEDCLYLNIFVPLKLGQSGFLPKPVMVWIHGGGFFVGSSNDYEGDVLSTFADVIVVTINYRLGPVGFFSTHDDNARGNYGVWDQHEAIKWVNENIAMFGGDTNNITIFGESAGSSSVVYQIMFPGNDGLFKRAIAESGSINGWGVTNKDVNYNGSMLFASTLGCKQSAHEELLKCIRSKPTLDVETAVAQLYNFTANLTIPKWVPVYDGEFVIADPAKILDEASDPNLASKYSSFRNKDLLIGVNNYDGGLLPQYMFGIKSMNASLSDSDLSSVYIPLLIEFVAQQKASQVIVDAVMNEYTDYTGTIDNMGSLIQMSTDSALNAPTVKTAKAHAMKRTGQTYLYQFSTSPPARGIPLPSYWIDLPNAANHGDDVAFVFGFPPSLTRYSSHKIHPQPSDINVSKLMMTAWSNFARSGNPNMPISLQSNFNVNWPAFTPTDQSYLEITPNISQQSVHKRLSARGVAFWNELMPTLLSLEKNPTH